MHIPDGYLGPQTYLPALGAMVPLWAWASAKLKKNLRARRVPLVALCSAFCFVIMMFNVPVPGGTTGHAVGAVLTAVLVGPWAAVVAVSLALIVQALVFGDGGITAIGANCLTMAVIMPLAGGWTFRLLSGRARVGSRVRWFAAAAAGYVGLNAAALATALLFGIQPAIARDAAGLPLYCPFGLNVAVPVMMLEHLLLFGFVEAAVTGFAVAYLDRAEPGLAWAPAPAVAPPQAPSRKLWWVLLALVLLSPLGLLLPEWLGAGSAWGEWGGEEVSKLIGYVPEGMARLGSLWRAPIPDYSAPGGVEVPWPLQAAWYLGSALIGALLLAAVLSVVRWVIARTERHDHAA
mgnify:CR=1 FL=1